MNWKSLIRLLPLLLLFCLPAARGAVAFSVSLDSPTNGATFGKNDKWVTRITAVGDNLTNVSVFTNGVLMYQRTNAPWSRTNDTFAGPSTNTIYVSASGSGGESTNTVTNTFTIYGQSIEVPIYSVLPPGTVSAITNAMPFLVGTVGAVSTTNLANSSRARMLSINQGRGFSFFTTLGTTNAGTVGPVVFIFELTQDRTNYTTTTNYQLSVPLNGASRVCVYTNFPPSLFDNVTGVRLRQIDNLNTNKTWVTNAWFKSN